MFCAEPASARACPRRRRRVAFSIACRVLPSAPAIRPARWGLLSKSTSFTSNESTNRSSNVIKRARRPLQTQRERSDKIRPSGPRPRPACGVRRSSTHLDRGLKRTCSERSTNEIRDLGPGLAQRRVAVRRDAHLAVFDAPLRGVERRELGHRRLVRFFCSRLGRPVARLYRASGVLRFVDDVLFYAMLFTAGHRGGLITQLVTAPRLQSLCFF